MVPVLRVSLEQEQLSEMFAYGAITIQKHALHTTANGRRIFILHGHEIDDATLGGTLEEGDSKQALINLAQLYSRNQRPEAATRCVERLLEACDEPEERAALLLALGSFSEQIRDYRGAVRLYRQALSLEPSHPQTWYFWVSP